MRIHTAETKSDEAKAEREARWQLLATKYRTESVPFFTNLTQDRLLSARHTYFVDNGELKILNKLDGEEVEAPNVRLRGLQM
jgi:hypothetical protein